MVGGEPVTHDWLHSITPEKPAEPWSDPYYAEQTEGIPLILHEAVELPTNPAYIFVNNDLCTLRPTHCGVFPAFPRAPPPGRYFPFP